jgi:Ran GTPase-activating protein (RanGAP) involved in mRNA processing and transport
MAVALAKLPYEFLRPLSKYVSDLDLIKLLKTDVPALQDLAVYVFKGRTYEIQSQEELDDFQRYFDSGLRIRNFLPTRLDGISAIDLWGDEVGNDGVRALANALRHNATLTTLELGGNMGGNQIGNDGARTLADVLRHNTTLTTLDLGWNQIGADGARALADVLRHNTTLTTLDLRANQIGNDGARALAEALRHNATLTTLNLRYNKIGSGGARALTNALHHNATLTTLDLRYNEISADNVRTLLLEEVSKGRMMI